MTLVLERALNGLQFGVMLFLMAADMDAGFALADRITVLLYGAAIARGDPDSIRGDPEVRTAYLGEGSG